MVPSTPLDGRPLPALCPSLWLGAPAKLDPEIKLTKSIKGRIQTTTLIAGHGQSSEQPNSSLLEVFFIVWI